MAEVEEFMLTTVDNPWSPFDHYDEWLQYDRLKGHDTPGLLARVANVGSDLPESEASAEIQRAIEELVRINPTGLLRKVTENQPTVPAQSTGGGVLAK
jgi:hypothetical protein